ncbi:glycoside hydrolase family 16 protein [Cryptosporangium japonicum]|uniref:GH16 domain-containing protein n=1 Tax=Cryptosporangium japonicum TaxID=80872 RepID=A0ABP3CZM3_9ACTN
MATAASVVVLAACTLVLVSSAPARLAGEGVLDGTASGGLETWSAESDRGRVELRRKWVYGNSVVDISRADAGGDWSLVLARLRDPQRFFTVGRIYRMEVYVRDLAASGARIGMLLADHRYAQRPTGASVYADFSDRQWHRLSRTFVVTSPGGPGTGFYLALPPGAGLHWQVTRASVRQVDAPAPARVSRRADTVVAFDGPAGSPPDARQWTHEVGGHGWGNDELQSYTEQPENSVLDGAGHLVITARRERTVGPDGVVRAYSSARLTTKDRVTVPARSYVEAEILAPVGTGVWPAFWLAGADIDRIGWPAAGELDVLEAIGAQPTVAHSAVHLASAADPLRDQPYGWNEPGGTIDLGAPLDQRSHRFGVYFDSRTVRFYVDRRERMALWADDARISGRTWPFGKPQYLLLNVAIGGGDPTATTFPRSMRVGPISVWHGGVPF